MEPFIFIVVAFAYKYVRPALSDFLVNIMMHSFSGNSLLQHWNVHLYFIDVFYAVSTDHSVVICKFNLPCKNSPSFMSNSNNLSNFLVK
jgi:uncharacterized membrane protein